MRDIATHEPAGANTPIVLRLGFTALVALAEATHLVREHLDGGIVSHHLLNDPALPAIWNGWGLVALPLLAWIASGRAFGNATGAWRLRRGFLIALGTALIAGLALSAAFSAGREDIAGLLLIALLLSAVAVRAYRIEWLLGFVLGMAVTFGAVLPIVIGGCIALLSAAAWFGARPLLARALAGMRG